MKSFAGGIGERVGVRNWMPFTPDELSFLAKIADRFCDQSLAQPAISENDDEDRHQRNDGE
jgi:hypothetical protein